MYYALFAAAAGWNLEIYGAGDSGDGVAILIRIQLVGRTSLYINKVSTGNKEVD